MKFSTGEGDQARFKNCDFYNVTEFEFLKFLLYLVKHIPSKSEEKIN